MTPPLCDSTPTLQHLAAAAELRLFLDYDGTLAEFAPTPDDIFPDPAVASLIGRLAGLPRTQVAITSGRRLSHVQALVPVPGILLAGTYGIELRWPDGTETQRVDWSVVRPVLDRLKPRWSALLEDQQGFYLEDKGWSLALHARFADEATAQEVLRTANQLADAVLLDAPNGQFRLLGGHKFLEIGPSLANKGRTIEFLTQGDRWPHALQVYIGDDDKDEEAFAVIKAQGGFAIVVAAADRASLADCRLPSPADVRQFLQQLAEKRALIPAS